MSPRIWIKHRMPQATVETAICARCGEAFQYNKVTRPRKYHEACARQERLADMRDNAAWVREQNKKNREAESV